MDATAGHLEDWTPDEIECGRRWVYTWRKAGKALDALRKLELQKLDTFTALSHLMTTADYTSPPFAPRPWSGLVEQQRWFRKAAGLRHLQPLAELRETPEILTRLDGLRQATQ